MTVGGNISGTVAVEIYITVCHCIKIYSSLECSNFRLPHSVQKVNSRIRLVADTFLASKILLFAVDQFQLNSLSRLLSRMHKLNNDIVTAAKTC